jgi:hypothetical protein
MSGEYVGASGNVQDQLYGFSGTINNAHWSRKPHVRPIHADRR